MNYVLVALGSALGGMARYWCSGFAARLIGEWFPWGTLIVNVTGSFIIGAFAALSALCNQQCWWGPVWTAIFLRRSHFPLKLASRAQLLARGNLRFHPVLQGQAPRRSASSTI